MLDDIVQKIKRRRKRRSKTRKYDYTKPKCGNRSGRTGPSWHLRTFCSRRCTIADGSACAARSTRASLYSPRSTASIARLTGYRTVSREYIHSSLLLGSETQTSGPLPLFFFQHHQGIISCFFPLKEKDFYEGHRTN